MATNPLVINSSSAQISQVRQRFHQEVEAAISKQINVELHASYVYLSMSLHFDRDDVALPNASRWFRQQSHEERGHALALMDYQNKRGGRVTLKDIKTPDKNEWENLLDAMQAALELEKSNNKSLLDLHKLSGSHNDEHLKDFVKTQYLDEQVDAIAELGHMVTNLKRVGPGVGEYVFDKELADHTNSVVEKANGNKNIV